MELKIKLSLFGFSEYKLTLNRGLAFFSKVSKNSFENLLLHN